MIKYSVRVLVSLTALLAFVSVCLGEDLMNPTDFSHKVRKKSTYKTHYPNLRVKVSIARVHDNQPVDTAFGKKIGGQEVAVVKTDGSAVVTAKNEIRYDTIRDEDGYGKRIREMMRYYLSSIKSIQLVEREDINAIIRELDFGDTNYVKTKNMSQVEMPEYIAKGFMSANDGTCVSEEAPGWDDVESEKKDGNPLMFLIRIYDTRTSLVKHIACGTGQNQSEAIKNAADNLKAHMDLLYPEVVVSEVAGEKLLLTGGRNHGLAPGIRFFLIRSEGMKSAIDYSDLEYVALCKVIDAQPDRATALVEETFPNAPPEIGDWVFYHREMPGW